ncbi:hypothetical protein ACJA23_03215 [Mycoplasma corogypsi]|uniref:hypothetical protein n=1 Tax=Mycoplasma corogypsi TaxID=2106 RepID=UPI003872BA24
MTITKKFKSFKTDKQDWLKYQELGEEFLKKEGKTNYKQKDILEAAAKICSTYHHTKLTEENKGKYQVSFTFIERTDYSIEHCEIEFVIYVVKFDDNFTFPKYDQIKASKITQSESQVKEALKTALSHVSIIYSLDKKDLDKATFFGYYDPNRPEEPRYIPVEEKNKPANKHFNDWEIKPDKERQEWLKKEKKPFFSNLLFTYVGPYEKSLLPYINNGIYKNEDEYFAAIIEKEKRSWKAFRLYDIAIEFVTLFAKDIDLPYIDEICKKGISDPLFVADPGDISESELRYSTISVILYSIVISKQLKEVNEKFEKFVELYRSQFSLTDQDKALTIYFMLRLAEWYIKTHYPELNPEFV